MRRAGPVAIRNVMDQSTPWIEAVADGVLITVKVVPGASRTAVVGVLGTRLKVAVAAAPEGGKANKAVCELLAAALRVPRRDVRLVDGKTRPEKRVAVTGIGVRKAVERLATA